MCIRDSLYIGANFYLIVFEQRYIGPNENGVRTPVYEWLVIENQTFQFNIYGIIFFMILGYWFNFTSIWHTSLPDERSPCGKKVIKNLWNQKSASDYLHFMKFECFQFILLFQCMMSCGIFSQNHGYQTFIFNLISDMDITTYAKKLDQSE